MTKDESKFKALMLRLASEDLAHEAAVAAGREPVAEAKAYEARRQELIDTLDRLRGTAAVTYAQFVEALQAGAGCAALFALRNGMDPKDPLKVAANEDLRSEGCTHSKATRRTP